MKKTNRTIEENLALKNLGKKIRKARELRGYTQEEFSQLCGFSRSYYTEIETGKRNISFLNLLRIRRVLKININNLIEK